MTCRIYEEMSPQIKATNDASECADAWQIMVDEGWLRVTSNDVEETRQSGEMRFLVAVLDGKGYKRSCFAHFNFIFSHWHVDVCVLGDTNARRLLYL